MHRHRGVLLLAALLAKGGSSYEATSIVADGPVPNSDLVNESDIWNLSWSRLTGNAPPALLKCVSATIAGAIFALLGMVVESIRNRKGQQTISQEEIGKLLPKRKESAGGMTQGGNGVDTAGTPSTSASDQQTPAAASSSRPSFSALRGGRTLTELEQAERQVKSILNKLTREKFVHLYDQLRDTCIKSFPGVVDRSEIVDVVAGDLFSKATRQHTFIEMYADLCSKLQADLEKESIQVNFKRVLLDQCQQSFKTYMEPPKIDKALDYEEQYEELVKYKTKMLGNIRLVGHLLIRRMLSPKIIFHCTDELLSIGTEEALETLIVFVETIGKAFDTPEWKQQARLQGVFTRMELLAESPQQSARVRCLLKDVLDLRRNRWRQLPVKLNLPIPTATPKPVSQADASPCWRSDAQVSASSTPQASNGNIRSLKYNTAPDTDASPCWKSSPTPHDQGDSGPSKFPAPESPNNRWDELRTRRVGTVGGR
jgi:hypothetical protein